MSKIDKFILLLETKRAENTMTLFLYLWCKYLIVSIIRMVTFIEIFLIYIFGINLLLLGILIDVLIWRPLVWVLSKIVTIEKVDVHDDRKCN